MGLIENVIGALLRAFCAGPNAASEPQGQQQQQQQQPWQQPQQQPWQQQQQQNQQQYGQYPGSPPFQQQQQQQYPTPQEQNQNQGHGQQHPGPHPGKQHHGKPHHGGQHSPSQSPPDQGAWTQNQHQNQNQVHNGAPHKPSSSPHSPGPHRPFVDQNQINQHDEGYMALRAQAKAAGDKMGKCFDQSHQAYSSGDGARAKELSEEANAHKREMERLNAQASQWIFVENNKDSKPGEVDLHGLYVKEAIAYTDQAIQAAQQRGDTEVHLIVGKGIHSAGHVAKIKPAIEELMQKHQLLAELDPHNSGVLIVYLNGGRGRDTSRGINPDEISRRLEKPGDDCVVM